VSTGDGIRCPVCDEATTVIETRQNRGSLRRRRRCLSPTCSGRITTIEMIAPKYRKGDTTQLVAIPKHQAALVEVVPRSLMTALREALLAGDVGVAAPEDELTC
jgi:transcriptional regulator NrdR family protein